MQRCVAALIGLVNVGAVVDQLGSHRLLAHVARHVERSVSKSVGLVDLTVKTPKIRRWRAIGHTFARRAKLSRTSAPILKRYFTISM